MMYVAAVLLLIGKSPGITSWDVSEQECMAGAFVHAKAIKHEQLTKNGQEWTDL